MWNPPETLVEESNVKKFMDKHGIENFKDLIRRSTEDLEWFWQAATEELKVEWFQKYTEVLDVSNGIQWAKWFRKGKLLGAGW